MIADIRMFILAFTALALLSACGGGGGKKSDRFVPSPMSDTARKIATVVQSMGCIFLVVSLAATIALYVIFQYAFTY